MHASFVAGVSRHREMEKLDDGAEMMYGVEKVDENVFNREVDGSSKPPASRIILPSSLVWMASWVWKLTWMQYTRQSHGALDTDATQRGGIMAKLRCPLIPKTLHCSYRPARQAVSSTTVQAGRSPCGVSQPLPPLPGCRPDIFNQRTQRSLQPSKKKRCRCVRLTATGNDDHDDDDGPNCCARDVEGRWKSGGDPEGCRRGGVDRRRWTNRTRDLSPTNVSPTNGEHKLSAGTGPVVDVGGMSVCCRYRGR